MKLVVWLLFGVIVVFGASAAQAQKPPAPGSNDWLNGKWEGRPPAGGELRMDIHVDQDGQIKGTGLIPGRGGEAAAHPQVTGTVKGKVVHLETFFPSAFPERKVIYNCRPAGEALQCKTARGVETTFKKTDKSWEDAGH